VLITKPQNKTPYELLIGRPPILEFIRPFGCPVTILNTLDYLGKFDGKSNEGFFVGYSINNSMNYKPVTAENQTNGNASESSSNDAGQSGKKIVPEHDYILLPLWTSNLSISKDPKDTEDVVPSDDAQRKTSKEDDALQDEFERMVAQEKAAKAANDTSSTNSLHTVTTPVNAASSSVNAASSSFVQSDALPDDPKMPHLEDSDIFGSAYDDR
ncbi:hypothetical protein Tco_0106531, partial [Tanacetum coccineum]